MDIFGFGGPEVLVIIILAGFVLGPERMVRAARQMGKYTHDLKEYVSTFTKELKTELDLVDQVKDIKRDIESKVR